MKPAQQSDDKIISINFEVYGVDDPEVKMRLLTLMMENIQELVDAASHAIARSNPQIFKTAVHKSKSTIKLLEDEAFATEIESLKESLPDANQAVVHQKLNDFKQLADRMLKSLARESLIVKGS
jgi:hypothetical protein